MTIGFTTIREFCAAYYNNEYTSEFMDALSSIVESKYDFEYIDRCQDFSNDFDECIRIAEDKIRCQ